MKDPNARAQARAAARRAKSMKRYNRPPRSLARKRLDVALGIAMLALALGSLFIIFTHSSTEDPCAHEYVQYHAPGGGIHDVDLQWFVDHCANYRP